MPGPYTKQDGFLGFNEICEELTSDKSEWNIKWEACHKATYMVNKEKWVSYALCGIVLVKLEK